MGAEVESCAPFEGDYTTEGTFPADYPTVTGYIAHPSICPSVRLSTYLSIHPFIRLSISAHPSISLSTHPSIHPSTRIPIHSSIHLYICSSICPPICPSIIYLSISLSIHLSIHHSAICPLVCPSIHPSIQPSIHPSKHAIGKYSEHGSLHWTQQETKALTLMEQGPPLPLHSKGETGNEQTHSWSEGGQGYQDNLGKGMRGLGVGVIFSEWRGRPPWYEGTGQGPKVTGSVPWQEWDKCSRRRAQQVQRPCGGSVPGMHGTPLNLYAPHSQLHTQQCQTGVPDQW